MFKNIMDLIGNTPLVRVNFDGVKANVYGKLEYLNPGGSVKDRTALFMIQEAEKNGILKPGGTIIEASSGNQGIAAAMIGAAKGYKVIITVSKKVSQEKRDALRAYGAQLLEFEPTMLLEDPESYHSKAVELQKNTPNSFMINQYFNKNNALSHYSSTGPEIYRQTNGKITHFCAAAGSCGTISGVGKYLKEQNPNIKVLAVDTATSYRSTQGNPKPYKLEGLGVDFDSPLLDKSVIDEFLLVNDDEAFEMGKKLARTQGILVGPAGAAAATSAAKYAKNLSENDILVIPFTDSGRAYLTKGYYN